MVDLWPEIDAAFAELRLGVALGCLALDAETGVDEAALDRALREAGEAAAGRAAGGAASVPAIAATRRAYKVCGKDPSRYRPASEALLRRVLKGDAPPRVNPLVDLNNLISLDTGFACGIYDRDALRPPVVLRLGRTDDVYEGIGRGTLNTTSLPVLADADGPFGSPTSDSLRSAVDATTTRALFVLYAFDLGPSDAMASACAWFRRHLSVINLDARIVTGYT